uniref:(northern house mosquito) hypothetical protein n=1 Tax=Culex pipiens TaxID=7175 RepID=A0A8D7ZWG7_CULPI
MHTYLVLVFALGFSVKTVTEKIVVKFRIAPWSKKGDKPKKRMKFLTYKSQLTVWCRLILVVHAPPSWLAYISTQHRRDRVLSLTTSLVFPLNLFRVPLGVWTAVPTPSAASTPFPVALLSVEMADFSPLPWAK